jgi:TPR repeat protein
MRALILAACLITNIAFADDFIGFSAYENADYTTAYQHLVKSANEGNEEAMYLIGRMQQYGLGVNENIKEAYSW